MSKQGKRTEMTQRHKATHQLSVVQFADWVRAHLAPLI